jgi:hypothetical protein
MNNPSPEKPTAKPGQRPGAPRSPKSIETSPSQAKHRGQVGLANESRPGLGTREREDENENAEAVENNNSPDETLPDDNVPLPPKERPEPSEQDSDSLAQEQQRETGVSGHSGST